MKADEAVRPGVPDARDGALRAAEDALRTAIANAESQDEEDIYTEALMLVCAALGIRHEQ